MASRLFRKLLVHENSACGRVASCPEMAAIAPKRFTHVHAAVYFVPA
jgi:hypothetical protein